MGVLARRPCRHRRSRPPPADVHQRAAHGLHAGRHAVRPVDGHRHGPDRPRLRVRALRTGAAVLARQGVGVERARVHRARLEPPQPGAHQAAAGADARGGHRHAEAVHLHLHPSRGRERVQPELAEPPRAGSLAGGPVPVRRDRRNGARLADLGLPRRPDRPPRLDPAGRDVLHRHRHVQRDARVLGEPGRLPVHGHERRRPAADRLLAARRDDPRQAQRRDRRARRRRRHRARVPDRELDRALADPDLQLADHVVLRHPDRPRADRAQPLHPRIAALPARERPPRRGPRGDAVVRHHDHRKADCASRGRSRPMPGRASAVSSGGRTAT